MILGLRPNTAPGVHVKDHPMLFLPSTPLGQTRFEAMNLGPMRPGKTKRKR